MTALTAGIVFGALCLVVGFILCGVLTLSRVDELESEVQRLQRSEVAGS